MQPEEDVELNEFTLSHANKQVEIAHQALDSNLDSKSDLRQIQEFLEQTFLDKARRRQSIITRSEAELFGISSPRYSTRLYLDGGGFLNCRRLDNLLNNLPRNPEGSYGRRYTDDEISYDNRNPDLKTEEFALTVTMEGQSCVADCLVTPKRLEGLNYRYIDTSTAKLFYLYNEKIIEGKVFTPFVKAITVGGGLCAQAVSFMATMSLSTYANSLTGLAEITTSAHLEQDFELSLSGLTPPRMRRYFKSVGLKMSEQTVSAIDKSVLTEFDRALLGLILRSYLRSDMPVIFPVNCSEMAKKIYLQNGYEHGEEIDPKNSAHVTIIVGYSPSKDNFVFHDPNVYPYMVASLSDLSVVGCPRPEAGPHAELPDNGVFMPVTPAQVQLPLLWERIQDNDIEAPRRGYGLHVLSKLVRACIGYTSERAIQGTSKKSYLLRQTSLSEDELTELEPEARSVAAEQIRKCLIELHEVHGWQVNHWIWYELFADSVWLWDAEQPAPVELPQRRADCCVYLLSAIQLRRREGKFTAFTLNVK